MRDAPNFFTSAASLGNFCPFLYFPERISRASFSEISRYFGTAIHSCYNSYLANNATCPIRGSSKRQEANMTAKNYLLFSDFDQTLSFHDSGIVLSELIGISGFTERVAGLSNIHLVQQGGELAYLLLHDPDFRRVRRDRLIEVGKRIRLKANIPLLIELLKDLDGHNFSFYVVSAAPQEVIESALEGIVDPIHIHGTRFRYDAVTGEIQSIVQLPAGYGKVAVVDELRAASPIGPHRMIYVGDGSSDVHVMLHVNRLGGLTIGVSENKYITSIAGRTVLSDDALSVLVPVLEDVLKWDTASIRAFFELHGFALTEWDKIRTDAIAFSSAPAETARVVQ
jgi:HAD superfamily phosphoserine phosphatase-like hydrolase